jgi:ketosteroid isomerase-like protein
MEAKNEATVRAILAAMDSGEYAKFDQYCSADYQFNNPFLPQPFIFTDEFNAEGKLKVRHVQFDTGAFNAQLMAEK